VARDAELDALTDEEFMVLFKEACTQWKQYRAYRPHRACTHTRYAVWLAKQERQARDQIAEAAAVGV